MVSRTESIVVTCGNGASMLEPFPSSSSALNTPALAVEHIRASLARLEARMDALERRAAIAQPPPWPDPDPPYQSPLSWYQPATTFQQPHAAQLPQQYLQQQQPYQQSAPPPDALQWQLPQQPEMQDWWWQQHQPHNPHWCPSASPQQLQLPHALRPTCWDTPQARQPYCWEPQARPSDTVEWQRPQQPRNQDVEPFRQLQNPSPGAQPWQLDCTVFSPPINHHSAVPLPASVPQPPQLRESSFWFDMPQQHVPSSTPTSYLLLTVGKKKQLHAGKKDVHRFLME